MQQPDKILFIDDDEPIRRAFARTFSRQGFDIDVAADGWNALKLAKTNDYAVIATDYCMPGINGLDLAEELRLIQPDATYMLISGNADLPLTLDAVNEHNVAYVIPKPWKTEELNSSMRRGIEQFWERRGHRKVAENMVVATQRLQKREAELKSSLASVESELEVALLSSLNLRDRDTERACARVSLYAAILARTMDIEESEVRSIERGALLHDVGKIGIPDSILLKAGPLDTEEWAIMRTHTQIGGRLVGQIKSLASTRVIVEQHHERWDGSGYPLGLAGDRICLGARILAVVDALDAILSDRPYRKGASYEVAREEIMRCSGTQFDAKVVQAFLSVPKERWLELRPRQEAHRIAVEEAC